MKLYIVRHGESRMNAMDLHQSEDVELSEHGLKQAEAVARRFLNIPIDIIISSSFTRARQTAEIINKNLNKPVEYSRLFSEMKNPSAIVGKPRTGPEAKSIMELRWANVHNPDWKHSDEENFYEFRSRALKGMRHLIEINKDNVLLITHGIFIDMILSIMAYGPEVGPNDYRTFLKFLHMDNTGLTLCKYEEDKWSMLSWNDRAHLG